MPGTGSAAQAALVTPKTTARSRMAVMLSVVMVTASASDAVAVGCEPLTASCRFCDPSSTR